MDEKPRWEKGLGLMHYAQQRKRGQPADEQPRRSVGRPRTRRMVHDALHAALMGIAKA